MKTVDTRWECRTYDVWGNPDEGFEVNDVERIWHTEICLDVDINNKCTERQFVSATPSDEQIRAIFGIVGEFMTEGDDLHIYVDAEDGYPIGEMICESHYSLSPIRRNKNVELIKNDNSIDAILGL